ncbi:MAG: PTS system mannose/fructose/sorbose family transporter subunit IID [bacterium]
MKKITQWDLFLSFLKSFYIQASWNFEKMQNIGLTFVLSSIINKLYSDSEKRNKVYARYISFFNIHPYTASFFIGMAIKIEENIAQGKDIPENFEKTKKIISSPLSVIGDLFFWETLKPCASLIGILIMLFFNLNLLGILTTFFIFNIPHFYVRIFGIWKGYYLEKQVVNYIKKMQFPKMSYFIGNLTLFLCGIAIVFFALDGNFTKLYFNLGEFSIVFIFIAITLIFSYILKKILSVTMIAFIFTGLGIIVNHFLQR